MGFMYLQRLPSGRYRVRLPIPPKLQAVMGHRTILTKSLSTSDLATAKRRAVQAIAELQRQLQEVETPAGAASKVPPDEALDLHVTMRLEEDDLGERPLDPSERVAYLALLNRHAGPTLSLILARWRGERQPTEKTVREFDRACCLFAELHGDLPVKVITREHVRDYKAALLARTTSRGTLAPATAAKLLNAIHAVLEWATRQGYTDVNAAHGVSQVSSVVNRKAAREARRLPFSVEQARVIMATIPDKLRWHTLVAFYTGARASEILGLRPDDWRQEDGVPHLSIEPHEGRGLKTAASRRRVPVHPTLLSLGLTADVLPFQGRASAFSQRFARWLRANVTPDPRYVFHSIRHLVRDRLRAARVSESEARALMGWSSQSVADAYGSGFPLSVLLRAVRKIRY